MFFNHKEKIIYLSFIGISNWILDAAKMNRGFTLSVPELHDNIGDIEETYEEIGKSINPDLWNNNKKYINIFQASSASYKDYKKELSKIEIDESNNSLCNGSRDFYFLIKNVAYSFNDLLKKILSIMYKMNKR
jgi:hypothetical protein